MNRQRALGRCTGAHHGRMAALLVAAALAACGGGDDESIAQCGGSAPLEVVLTYEVNGTPVKPTTSVFLARGAPFTAVPRAVGLPAACADKARITVSTDDEVPDGLTFDPATGALAGTPVRFDTFGVRLQLHVDGYINDLFQDVRFVM